VTRISCGKLPLLNAALVLLLLLLLPLYSQASQTVVLKVMVNMEDKGDYFIVLTPDGDALIRRADLKEMGFEEVPEGVKIFIDKEEYVSLKSLSPRVTFKIDDKESALSITSDPNLFGKNLVNLAYARPADVLYTRDNTAFLNYNLTYSFEDSLDFTSLSIPWEVGVNIGGWLGFSNFAYTKTEGDENFVRLFSNITTDDRTTLRRVVVGDFSAFSGTLGSGGILGGLSISKNFAIMPYFVRFPGLDLSGVLETPSEVKLYVDDMLIRREHFSPGEFEFLNLPGATGSGNAFLVIEDAYGRERTIDFPFYMSTQLLKTGLHDYSYNFGFKREELGQKSFEYGDPAFVGYHRFGFTSSFTGGLRAEADQNVGNLGVSVTFVPWRIGETNASLAASYEHKEGRQGYGGFLSHFYAGENISGGFSTSVFSREYSNLGLSSFENRLHFVGSVNLGFNHRNFGSISATYSVADYYEGTDTHRASIYYSRRLLRNASLYIRASRTESDEINDEVFAGILFFPGSANSASLGYQVQDGRSTETASFQKNPPVGPGLGYRFLVEHSEDVQGDKNLEGNAFVQYRGPYGIYSADYRRIAERNIYDLGVSGGVAFINKFPYLTRPISDAFALVKVGDLSDVKVKYSNQEVGTTNADGEVVVPDLISYYNNELSIEPKDIPVNYEIQELRKYVSPPLRGGGIVKFAITKIQGFGGQFYIVEKGEKKAAEYWGLRIKIEGVTKEFTVGKGGEFYLENLPAGKMPAELFWQDRKCDFDLTIPKSDDVMVDMGEVTCEMD